jgi:hypothetical protein
VAFTRHQRRVLRLTTKVKEPTAHAGHLLARFLTEGGDAMIDWLVREIDRPRLTVAALVVSVAFLLYFGLATDLGTAQGESADYFATLSSSEIDDIGQAAILDFGFMVVYVAFAWLLVIWLSGIARSQRARVTSVVAVILVTAGALCDVVENIALLRILDDPSSSDLDDRVELMHDFGAAKYTLLALGFAAAIVLAVFAYRERTPS